MNTAAKKELRMRRLSPKEIGDFRLDIMSALARSCDPTAGVVYPLDMEPCLALAREASERLGRKITFAHVLNKLVAMAIDENPAFNQVVLGRSVYQLEGIHLSNAFMLPGKEQVLTYIIFDNPHRKTLAEIQQEAIMKMVEKTREHAGPKAGWRAPCRGSISGSASTGWSAKSFPLPWRSKTALFQISFFPIMTMAGRRAFLPSSRLFRSSKGGCAYMPAAWAASLLSMTAVR